MLVNFVRNTASPVASTSLWIRPHGRRVWNNRRCLASPI